MSKLSSQQWEALSAERKDLQERGLLPDWYITQGWEMFKNKYMYKGEGEGVRGRFETIAKTLAKHMKGEEEKWEDIFFNILWSGRLSASSPVLANTGTDRGMNVSCSGQFIGDSVLEFYNGMTETAILSQHGFGTSGDFSSIRPRGASISKGGKASGPVPVIEDFFTVAAKISQGGTRRGSFAAYLDIEHPDWDEAIDGLMANPDGKNYGWTIKNSFIEKLKAGDKDAHRKFTKALYTKLVTGKGYFFFKDKANELRPQMYKDLGLEVEASNLCSEIMLHSSPEYTYSCILASMNLVHWDHLKESDDIFNATVFLDCVTEDFIQMSEGIPGLEKVREFTIKGRAIGLGAMGFHTYLQSKGIPFESLEAQFLANDMAKRIQSESLRASQYLAELKGEPEWCKGYGVRNTHRCVTGDTTVLTREGEKPIGSLEGKTLEIWNGHEWSEVTPFKTSEKEDVYKVTLSNGVTIKCTPDHKWTIKNNRNKAEADKVETLHLTIGDKLDKWELPVIEGTQPIPHPYTSGFFAGDGSYNQSKPQYEKCKGRKELRLYERGGKVGCIPYLAVKDGCEVRVREVKRGREIPDKEYRFYLEDSVCEKDFVPGMNHLQNDRLLWLAGLFDADGSNAGTISTADLDFAKEVQKLAGLCGLQARISEQQRAGEKLNLNGKETVRKRNIYCIGFSRRELVDKGLDKLTKRVSFGNPNREARQRVAVVSIEYFGQEATYCLTEPKRGTALFNGVKTAQCAYAPTKSSALLMGGVSESWSPDPGMVFEMASSVGELRRIPPVFYEKMKEKGVYNEETITDIINHSGSVQHVDWLTEEEKQVFRNAYEVDQFVILRHASQRQRHTCQGQSLNFFVADQGSEPLIAELMSEVFKDPYILGQYYLYSKSGVVVPEDCVACSA